MFNLKNKEMEKLIDFCGNPANNENIEEFNLFFKKKINLEYESQIINSHSIFGQIGETALLRAIRANNINLIEILINKNVDVNHVRPSDGVSPLMLAAYQHQQSEIAPLFGEYNIRLNPYKDKVINLLITAGANIDYYAKGSGDVLTFWRGDTKESKIFKHLIDNKKEINCLTPDGSNCLISLIAWIDINHYKQLHEKGADINILNQYNHSPFMNAAHSGRLDIVQYLLENNVDLSPESTKLKEKNIINHLKSQGQYEVIELIEKYPFYKKILNELKHNDKIIDKVNKI